MDPGDEYEQRQIAGIDLEAEMAALEALHRGPRMYDVHLLGKAFTGPFSMTDPDGSPRLEVGEIVPGTDAMGRETEVASEFDTSCSANATRADLLEALGPGSYRVQLRARNGHILGGDKITIGGVPAPVVAPMSKVARRTRPALGALGAVEAQDDDRVARMRRSMEEAEAHHERAMRRLEDAHDARLARVVADLDREVKARREAEDSVRKLREEVMDWRFKAMQAQTTGGQAVLTELLAENERLKQQPAERRPSMEETIKAQMDRLQSFANVGAGFLGGIRAPS